MNDQTHRKLAIIIPYYKIDFFEETLRSIAMQTNKNFCLYIGNDASPNDPVPVIHKYFSPGEYKYFNYKTNVGGKNLVLQWERILEHVNEDWFQILGDDDLISNNFVEEFYKHLKKAVQNKSGTIRINHIQIDEDGNIIKDLKDQEKISDPEILFYRQYTYEISSTLSENIFKTKNYRFKKFNKIPLAWGSDHLAIFDFADTQPIYYLTEASVQVRISKESISGSTKNLREKKEAYQIYRQTILTKYAKILNRDFILKVYKDYRNTAADMNKFLSFDVTLSMLSIGELRIALSTIKKNLSLFRAKRRINKYLFSQKQFKFKQKRYTGSFLGSNKILRTQEAAPEKIFCFWTGTNPMSENRLRSLYEIRKNIGVEQVLVTPENLNSFIIKENPLHPSFKNLSLVHKSDYLRGYFMYHYGGGYTDIKIHYNNWQKAFEKLNSSKTHIGIGYREEEAKYVGYAEDFVDGNSISVKNINEDLKNNFLYLIGNGSYIFKPKTSLWKEWLEEVHRRLDKNARLLDSHPGNILGDNEGYPLPWTSILGQIFHPLCLKYHTELFYDDQIKPIMKNYR